ncbi:MAG: histidine kinase [Flavobacterium sp. BFFFF1]|uniref:response regulator n=1 Tax=Flavobacterium sp. BFFFF1 TaxID=2015557 RepID=UPI000BCCC259|nr:response regulator [Flavobacterium sp. BFFFF1]OYU79672.1 MAG: histidine kinase [Flavobacterium sp. BFFFF1]
MQNNFKRNLVVSSTVSMLILIISSTASYLSIQSLLESNNWVNHTQEVIYNLNQCSAEMSDAQTGVRGFLITGKTVFLDRYSDSESKTDGYLEKIQALTADNKEQQLSLSDLKPIKNTFYTYLELRVASKTNGLPVKPDELDTGKKLMDEIRAIFKRMEARENQLLKERTGNSEKYGAYSSLLIVFAALIAVVISIVFFIRIIRDYNDRVKLQRELEQNEYETAERIRVISNIAEQISSGNYNIRVNDTESDALGSVAISLNNMAASLNTSFNLLSDREWMQTGIAELNNVMLGEKNLEELAKEVVEFISVYTGSSAGVFYLIEGEVLYIAASYSYIPSGDRTHLKIGEGLSGQAAASGRLLELKSLEPDNIKISYALGEIKPTHVVAVPMMELRTEGVIELASVKEYTPLHLEFLEAAADNIAIAVKAALSRKRVQELLEETQAQTEELTAQHSELESMNAELETQTEKLQASEEELKVQQEELQQTNEELAERSVLLEEQNTEIQKKSEALELSTKYKSEFLANMSHELRTPLNSILLLSRLLSENNEGNMSNEQMEFARVIQSSGNGLLALIDEILDLSKIEAGKMELEILDISVQEIADSMKSLFSEVARDKKIEFKVISDKAPLVMKTDKMRLEQILKNLISNAIKFTSKGTVTLDIHKDPGNEKRICFTVKDTGIGIPKEQQPLIFEAFQQADGSTKRKYGGTGLGLSISRELAKLLHGSISLESVVDEGSSFTLCIPVSASVSASGTVSNQWQETPMHKPLETVEATVNPYLSKTIPDDIPDDRDNIGKDDKTILIVEDDTNFAKSLLDFTRQKGYKGIVSVRGDYALNLALKYRPVGVLLDIQLPVKSGWEVMEELKSNATTRPIPVHIMSSHRLKQESLLKGAVNFLDKPVAYEQMTEIFKRIEHIVNRDSQKVLIIEDNSKHAKALAYFLETHSIISEIKSEVSEGVDALQKPDVHCVILDMGIPDRQSYEILEGVKSNPGLENLPIIVFTGKSLSMQEELKLKKYADSIVIKTAHSYQRMIDEVSLFLHLVEEKKSDKHGKNRNLQLLNNVLSNKTVLVVDDDVRNIYSLTKALEVLQMRVLTAIDGNEALKIMDEHPDLDVVLLDMMMPNMDGYETAKRIREIKRFKSLPVIAVTAKAMVGDREKCINAGASDYITKPVDVDQLLSLLRVWLYDKQ